MNFKLIFKFSGKLEELIITKTNNGLKFKNSGPFDSQSLFDQTFINLLHLVQNVNFKINEEIIELIVRRNKYFLFFKTNKYFFFIFKIIETSI